MRNRRLMALRNGQVQILVATDVAARGIDVPTITHVFNFGLPMKAEDYTHRIGRTGRAGRDGLAVTFAEIRDRRKIGDIESYTRQPFKAEVIPGMEPKTRIEARKPMGGGRGGDRFGGDRNYANASGGFRGRSGGGGGGRDFGNRDGGFDNRAPRGNFREEQPRFEQRAEPRFEPRFDPRKDGRGDARFDNRGGDRFEQRAAAPAHPWDRDNRGGPRQDARGGEGRQGGRWEDRGGDRNASGPRGGAGDKFARGPKQFGAGNFKPHNAGGGEGKRGGTRVLKITRG